MTTNFNNVIVSDSLTANNITCNSIQTNEANFDATDILVNGTLYADTIINNTLSTLTISAPVINLGMAGSTGTVNILGNLNYINVEELQIKDPIITINKGGTDDLSCGLEVERNGSISQFFRTYGATGPTGGSTGWDISGEVRANKINCSSIGCTGPVSMTTLISTGATFTGNVSTTGNFTAGDVDTDTHNIRGNINLNANAGATGIINIGPSASGAINIKSGVGSTGLINIGSTGTQTNLSGQVRMASATNNKFILGNQQTNSTPGTLLNITNITTPDTTVNGVIGASGVFPQFEFGSRNFCFAEDAQDNLKMYFGCVGGGGGNDPDFEYTFKRATGLKINPTSATNTDFTEALNVVGDCTISGTLNSGVLTASSITSTSNINTTTLQIGNIAPTENVRCIINSSIIDTACNGTTSGTSINLLSLSGGTGRHFTFGTDGVNNQQLYLGSASGLSNDPDYFCYWDSFGRMMLSTSATIGAIAPPVNSDILTVRNGNVQIDNNLNIGGNLTVGNFNLSNVTTGTITFNRVLATPTLNTQLGFIVDSGFVTNAAATSSRVVRSITSITLPPGVWDIRANCLYTFGVGVLATNNQVAFIIDTTNTADPYSFLSTDRTVTTRGWDTPGSGVILYDNTKTFFSVVRNLTVSTTLFLNGTGGNSTNGAVTTYAGQLIAVRIG